MPSSYSMDLRSRVFAYVETGHSCHGAARHFDVSASFVIKLIKRARTDGTIVPKPRGGSRLCKINPYQDYLVKRVEAKPDITLYELVAELKEQFDVTIHFTSVGRFLRKAGFSYKKNATGAGIRTR